MRDKKRMTGKPWPSGLIATALAILPQVAFAQVPDEFLGTWSNNPPRCRQVNGEVDVLEVTKSSLSFYEIGCELEQPAHRQGAIRFSAQCYKGGSPMSKGIVILRSTATNEIDLALQGFLWTSEKPESFHRCHHG